MQFVPSKCSWGRLKNAVWTCLKNAWCSSDCQCVAIITKDSGWLYIVVWYCHHGAIITRDSCWLGENYTQADMWTITRWTTCSILFSRLKKHSTQVINYDLYLWSDQLIIQEARAWYCHYERFPWSLLRKTSPAICVSRVGCTVAAICLHIFYGSNKYAWYLDPG